MTIIDDSDGRQQPYYFPVGSVVSEENLRVIPRIRVYKVDTQSGRAVCNCPQGNRGRICKHIKVLELFDDPVPETLYVAQYRLPSGVTIVDVSKA